VKDAAPCFVCGSATTESDQLVLVRGKRQLAHCSDACLRETVRKQRAARTARQVRWSLRFSLSVLVLVGAGYLWQRFRVPHPESISSAWPDVHGEDVPPPVGPIFFGPPWPPTDDEWIAAFNQGSGWIYPLAGPNRRNPIIDKRIFGPGTPRELPPMCRKDDRCGVDLDGDLWGEHVYAARDGIVDRVQGDGRDQNGGQYVRLSHFGGMVFTQYFHLAAIPRGLRRGVHVKAGDVIGLLGDTGIEGERRHLYFALSIRPSKDWAEVYWDPTPWLVRWPLLLPVHGTVAGFVPPGAASIFRR
jgi:hypothetical protein